MTDPLRRTRPRSTLFDALPELPFKPWQRALERRTRLTVEEQQAERTFNELSARRDQAIRADREALGKAIADGKPEPDDEAVAAVDVELEAVRRRHEAVGVAIQAAEDELTTAINAHRADWTAKMAADVDAVRDEARQAFTAYVTAAQRLAELEVEAKFVQTFPDGKTFKLREPKLPELLGRNNDPFTRSEVHAALAAALEPPLPQSSRLPNTMPVPGEPQAVA